MKKASDNIIIKKAENIDAAGYTRIPELMRLTSDVLNPNKATLIYNFPVLQCEMDGIITVSAKIIKEKNKKRKSLKEQLEGINETQVIKEKFLQAEENGSINSKAKLKIQSLLKKPDYKNLPDEGKQELVSKWLSLQDLKNEPFRELLTITGAKYNPDEKSMATCVSIIIELARKISDMLDAVNAGDYLTNEQSNQLRQELVTLQNKIEAFCDAGGIE